VGGTGGTPGFHSEQQFTPGCPGEFQTVDAQAQLAIRPMDGFYAGDSGQWLQQIAKAGEGGRVAGGFEMRVEIALVTKFHRLLETVLVVHERGVLRDRRVQEKQAEAGGLFLAGRKIEDQTAQGQ
jgi:hypothetical protein